MAHGRDKKNLLDSSGSSAHRPKKASSGQPKGFRETSAIEWCLVQSAKHAADHARRHGAVMDLVLFVGLFLVAMTAIWIRPEVAHASNGKPPTRASLYIDTSNLTTAYNRGCTAGTNAQTGEDEAIVLDFGAQNSANIGTLRVSDNGFMNYQTDRNIAVQFAYGYWICTGSNTTATLELGLGTNNDESYLTSTFGSTWATQVTMVQNWINGHYGQVIVHGADDIESWGSYSVTHAWVTGFDGNGVSYYNFGSADGCSTSQHNNGSCSGSGWNQYSYWFVSWGDPAAFVTPEIYYTSMAAQWEQISLYGSTYQSSGIFFSGPWTECELDGSTLCAQDAWDALKAQTGQNPPYSLKIDWE